MNDDGQGTGRIVITIDDDHQSVPVDLIPKIIILACCTNFSDAMPP